MDQNTVTPASKIENNLSQVNSDPLTTIKHVQLDKQDMQYMITTHTRFLKPLFLKNIEVLVESLSNLLFYIIPFLL